LHYDINEVGEMHHNPAKNVLYVRAPIEQIAVRLGMPPDRVEALLASAREKLYAARLRRPTPFVDKTVYVNWNALCISAYLEAARVLQLDDARRFALRSLDRILAEAWDDEQGLRHVVAYSEPAAEKQPLPGLLDAYAFTALACLDAYEATSDLSYFHFAQRIADRMIARFFDEAAGGFFDAESAAGQDALGVLGTRRKPFQDSPTPSGNSAAIMALLRLYSYTSHQSYREKAESTVRIFAGVAEQYGMFAATYGIAAVMFSEPHAQVVVIGGGEGAGSLCRAALTPFSFSKSVLKFSENEITPQNLPPALAETLPALPRTQAATAVICSGFKCQPPITDAEQLAALLREGRV
ncbi:MAG TPA: thioredoxin domain-containing protein, partial [Terriglobales bacterium]|nr:thioredoxin domain-containing protein [Terriglobales bacterium]